MNWRDGFHLAGGVCLMAAIVIGVAQFLAWLPIGRDDTDPSSGARSGMSLHVDARTGCHYLARTFGGLTPRLDRNGKPVCELSP